MARKIVGNAITVKIKKEKKKIITKMKQRRLRMITLQGAIEKCSFVIAILEKC